MLSIKRIQARFKKAFSPVGKFFSKLIPILQVRGRLFAVGLISGAGFVWLSIPIHESQFLINLLGQSSVEAISLIVKELGVGFFVAAIAVIGYEWGSHSKEALDLTKTLVRIMESEGLERIKLTLEQLFSECDEARDFHRYIHDIVKTSNEIAKQDSVAKKEYLKVISWLLNKPIKVNSERLKDWLLNEKEGHDWEYSMPYTPPEVAGSILGTQMKIIQKSGGFYNSISKISFWEGDKLDYFFEKTKEAVMNPEQEIIVKRVFNLCNAELDSFIKAGKKTNPQLKGERKQKMKTILKILSKHEKLETDSNHKYQVKFFLPEKIRFVKENIKIDQSKIESAGYGIFRVYPSDYFIRFIAEDEDLLSIKMGYCKDKDESILLFDQMFEYATAANPFKNFAPLFPASQLENQPPNPDLGKPEVSE
jgi:hypothetical protein